MREHDEEPGPVVHVPLYSEEAEMCVLGACLLGERAAEVAFGALRPEDFHAPRHATIFDAMRAVAASGNPLDIVTLQVALTDSGRLEWIGGQDYLTHLDLFVPSAANQEGYVAVVKDKSARREAIRIAREIRDAALEGRPLEAIAEIGAGIASRASAGKERSAHRNWKELVQRVPHLSKARGVPSGNPALDRILSTKGLAIGQVTMVTAETGGGKTTWMLGSMFKALEAGERCAFLSFADLDADEVTRRACRWKCGLEDYRDCYTHEEKKRLADALEAIYSWDLEIFDAESSDGANDYETAKAWLLRIHAEQPLDRSYWDYAQEIETSAPSMARMDRFHRQAYIAKRCRILAGQMRIAFVIGAQLTGKGDDEAIAESKFWEKVASLILRVSDTGLTIRKSRFGGVKTTVPHKYRPERWTHETEAMV